MSGQLTEKQRSEVEKRLWRAWNGIHDNVLTKDHMEGKNNDRVNLSVLKQVREEISRFHHALETGALQYRYKGLRTHNDYKPNPADQEKYDKIND